MLATIGYQGASLEDFIATLRRAGVRTVLDVRDAPVSRRKGFSKKALAEALEASDIRYVHLPALGNPKEGRDAARDGRVEDYLRIYMDRLGTPEAKAALGRAALLASEARACLLCYERNPMACHRKLLADMLATRMDLMVRHLGVREGAAEDSGEQG